MGLGTGLEYVKVWTSNKRLKVLTNLQEVNSKQTSFNKRGSSVGVIVRGIGADNEGGFAGCRNRRRVYESMLKWA